MTACECAEPRESPNPRKAGSCVKCGKYLDPTWVSSDETMTRFYNRLSDCQNVPITFPEFRAMAERREKAGREVFGYSYLVRDNPLEGLEEFSDGANYAFFDTLRAEREGRGGEDMDLALQAAFHAAQAYDALVRLRSKRHHAP